MRQAILSTSKVTGWDSLPISARIASVMTEAWVMGRLLGRAEACLPAGRPCSYSGAVNPNVCVREHTSAPERCQTLRKEQGSRKKAHGSGGMRRRLDQGLVVLPGLAG